MGLPAIQVTVVLTEINCGECGGTYAINERYRQTRYEKGESWTCPYCATGWGYTGNSENAKLKRELEAERQRKEAALSRENEQRAAKEKLERKLRRVGRGICPECNRSFANLARHMNCKHGGIDGKIGKPKLP